MSVVEDKSYSKDYHNPEKRSITNAIQIFFKDGSSTDKVEVEYPLGHRFHRDEEAFLETPVNEFMSLLVI